MVAYAMAWGTTTAAVVIPAMTSARRSIVDTVGGPRSLSVTPSG